MGADGSFEPGPGPSRLVEHGGVGDLELGYGERPGKAGPVVVGGEGVGHDRHHAAEQAAHVPRTEPGASAAGKSRVVYRAQAVVQSRVAEAGLSQLALGPFVAIGAAPQPVRRVTAHFQERRPPLLVGKIKVPVVGDRGHAGPGDVRVPGAVAGVGRVDKAPPRAGALLRLAHQDQPGAAGRESFVLVGPGNVLFYLVALETHDRHACRGHQGVEAGNQAVVGLVEGRRRRDRVAPR